MKASTLFGITFGLLVSLGVVGAAKYAGIFEPRVVEKKSGNGIQILVATRNLLRGTTSVPGDTKLRPLMDSERETFERIKDKLMPPLPSAAEYRVLAKSVAAGQPILEEYFEPASLPEPVTARLDPGMRSASLVLPRERAAGGLIRVGERVDILLTTVARPGACKNCPPATPSTVTATIARDLKVIVKRDNLYTMMAPVPQDKPASYIVQANPYRAALIEFAKNKGILTMVPAAVPAAGTAQPTNSESREYRDEDKRVRDYLANDHIISDADLQRIFNLQPRLVPTPEPQLTRVEIMIGNRFEGTLVVDERNATTVLQKRGAANGATMTAAEPEETGFTFCAPGEEGGSGIARGVDRKSGG
jgi:Flp pilus assembly protein CpaB